MHVTASIMNKITMNNEAKVNPSPLLATGSINVNTFCAIACFLFVLNLFESQIVFNFFLRISILFFYRNLNLNFRSQILFKLNSCTCLQPEKCACTNTSSVIHTLAKIFNNNNSSTTHITLTRGQVDVRLFILIFIRFRLCCFSNKK